MTNAKFSKSKVLGISAVAIVALAATVGFVVKKIRDKKKNEIKRAERKPTVILVDNGTYSDKVDIIDKTLKKVYKSGNFSVYTIGGMDLDGLTAYRNIDEYNGENVIIIDNIDLSKVEDIDLLEMFYGYGKFYGVETVIIMADGGLEDFISRRVKFTGKTEVEKEYTTFELQYAIDGCVQILADNKFNIIMDGKLNNVSDTDIVDHIQRYIKAMDI